MKARLPILTILISSFFSLVAQADTECDSSFVSFDGLVYNVTPGAADDAVNLQCAIDEAISLGSSSVKLGAGDFVVTSSLSFRGFEGVFEGKSIGATRVALQDTNDDISMALETGKLTFRYMTIESEGSGVERAVFKVLPNQDDCSSRVIRLELDRVSIVGNAQNSSKQITGLRVDTGQCPADEPVLGTILVNRSDIRDVDRAIDASMGGGARVDIYYSTIEAGDYCFVSYDANQSLNFIGNTCGSSQGVGLFGSSKARVNAMISGNRFSLNKFPGESPFLVEGQQTYEVESARVITAQKNNVSVTVSQNTVSANYILGPNVTPLVIRSPSAVFDNVFFGPISNRSRNVIELSSFSATKGSAIYGNSFADSSAFADVFVLDGQHTINQKSGLIAGDTDLSLYQSEVTSELFSPASDVYLIDLQLLTVATASSVVSINGVLQNGSQLSATLNNDTGYDLTLGQIKFLDETGVKASGVGADFLTDGLLRDGESLSLTYTVGFTGAIGDISVIYDLDYEGDFFDQFFVVYTDPS